MRVIIENKSVCKIPVLDIYNMDAVERQPMIFILHGATGKKENNIERAYEFAKEGFFVVLFDAYRHGELKDENTYSQQDAAEVFKVYSETSSYINILIDSYKDNSFADFERIGLMGISMGAHTIYNYITKERSPNVKVAVPIIGSPVWTGFVRRFIGYMPDLAQKMDEQQIVRIEKYVDSIQPYKHLQKVKDFPLLMLNGETDERISINDLRNVYTELLGVYSQKDYIKFIEYKGVGHQATQNMMLEARSWFKKYLIK